MKKMRILSILLALLLVFSLSLSVLADDAAKITVESRTEAAKAGDEVTLTVSIENNPGFLTAVWEIGYDSSKLALQSINTAYNVEFGGQTLEVSYLKGVYTPNLNENKVGFMNDTLVKNNGTIFTLTFLVKGGAAGKTAVSVTAKQLFAEEGKTVTAGSVSGGVTIAGSTGGSTGGGSTTGGSTTGKPTTGGSTTGKPTTGGSTTGKPTTGGSTTGKPVPIVTIALRDAAVSVGGTIQLEPVFTPADTTQRDVTWSSSNSNIATIDANGRVTGVAEGTATITVTSTAAPAITASCTVTVTKNLSDAGLAAIIAAIGNGSLPFNDVTVRDYFYDAVLWAVDRGITSGTSRYTFSPDAPCTRAQVVTFLWRAAGCPQPVSKVNPFTDVCADDYFYAAVLWAVENGITNGTSAKTFSPDATVTRAQVVTFLWRANGQPAAGPSGFVDVSSNAYYARAVDWAFENSITTGMNYGAFGPDTACTRAQIVTFLYRAR